MGEEEFLMSYSSQVADSFTKEDWDKKVYPKI